jgi:tetratricopeptide (TPR) repeat protein
MERVTWPDPSVVQWFNEHGLATRIEIDEEKNIADLFTVRSVPTLIAMRDEKEVDRIVGARSASDLIAWLEGLREGRTERRRLEREASGDDLQARYQLALAALGSGDHASALRELAWLWSNALNIQPAWVGVRHSFLLGSIAQLVAENAAAREHFSQLRDEARDKLNGDIPNDWLALNQALGEQDRSIAWFETLPRPIPAELAASLEFWLVEPLQARERWADLALLFPDPMRALEQREASTQQTVRDLTQHSLPAEEQQELTRYFQGKFRQDAALLVRACRAAGRSAEAERLRQRALDLDPGEEMRSALSASGPDRA